MKHLARGEELGTSEIPLTNCEPKAPTTMWTSLGPESQKTPNNEKTLPTRVPTHPSHWSNKLFCAHFVGNSFF